MIELVKGKSYYCIRQHTKHWTRILFYKNYRCEDEFYINFESSTAWSYVNNQLKKLYRNNLEENYKVGKNSFIHKNLKEFVGFKQFMKEYRFFKKTMIIKDIIE
jgi:hypothetical protein